MAAVVLAPGIAAVPQCHASPTAALAPQLGAGGHGEHAEALLDLRRNRPVPAFNLIDQHGKPITQQEMQGKWTIMFFGYTHCPDYCPTTLMTLKVALRRLRQEDPNLGDRIQVIFVSVDPFRDTPAVLADYVSYFDPRFIGASGSPQELKHFTELLGVTYDYENAVSGASLDDTARRPPGDYVVDHSADIYIFDDHTRLLTWVAPPQTTTAIMSILKGLIRH
jgi:protein SCO1/2